MYRGFNLTLKEEFFENKDFDFLYEKGETSIEQPKVSLNATLKTFLGVDGALDGSKMQAHWFPQIKADVFISHSHEDEELAIALAGWLKETFGLTAFIDSCVWGYADDLIGLIDNKYCRKGSRLYNYEKRNYSTSHVHTMLSVALTQMIDNTECLFFLNTPNSLTPNTFIEQTESPWIYSEIVMSRLIRENPPERKKSRSLNESQKTFATRRKNIPFSYDLSVDHLTAINSKVLTDWQSIYEENKKFSELCGRNTPDSLDKLYEITEKRWTRIKKNWKF
jgi:hypothetical protein